MKHSYSLLGRQLAACGLGLLLLAAPRAWGQQLAATTIYYTQGSSTATLDAVKTATAAGGSIASVTTLPNAINQPTDVVLDQSGVLYVADQYLGTGPIYRYTTAGTAGTTVVSALAGATYNGLALNTTTRELYFTQAGATASQAALKKVSLAGALPATATTVATLPGTFTRPGDLAFDAAAGVLYVADQRVGGSIIKVVISTGTVTTALAGVANATYNGLALDAANGRLYITQGSADASLNALKVLTLSSSNLTTLVSGATNFAQPSDIAFEPSAGAGRLFLTDQYVTTGALLRYDLAVASGTVSAGNRTALIAGTAGANYGGLALRLAPTLVIAPTTLPGGTVNTAYSQTITTSGGTAPYAYSVTGGALPNGLTLTTAGVLSGTPTVANTFNFTITSTDNQTAGGPYTTSQNYTVTIAPAPVTVTAVTLSGTSPTNASSVSFGVTFSGTIAGLTTSNFLPIATGTLSGASVTSVAGSGTSYTVTVNTGTGSGTLGLNVANTTGTTPPISNVPYTTGPTYTIDRTAPTVTSVAVPANATYAAGQTLSFTVNFSEVVTVTGTPLLGLTIGSTSKSASYQSGSGTSALTFSYPVVAGDLDTDGITINALTLNSGTIRDAATNNATLTLNGVASTTGVRVDAVAPTVTISSTATSPTNTAPIPVTFTFSEPVLNFGVSGITVTNGTFTSVTTVNSSTYTISITPTTTNGTITVNVPAGAAQDGAGNNSVAATQFSIQYAVIATSWTGTVSTDWFNAGNWSAGVPTATVSATIPSGVPNYPVLTTGTATALNLTLNSGATLTQSGGTLDLKGNFTKNGTFTATGGLVSMSGSATQSVSSSTATRFANLTVGPVGTTLSGPVEISQVLTLTGNLTTNGSALTLLSSITNGDALVVNNGGVVTGNATVQRAISPTPNPGLGYRHYSAPISNATVASLATSGFAPVVNSDYNASATPGTTTPFPTVFGYDQARLATVTSNYSAFDKGFFSPTSSTSALAIGRGYAVNIAASELVSFVGTLNNGDQPIALTRNSGATAADAGWHLVGNPYPAPLDYSLVLAADRTNLDAAIYVVQSSSQYAGSYRSYVNGMGSGSVLPTAQGFFVRVNTGQTSGTLNFRNSQRLTAPNATAFQRTTADPRPPVQLTLHGATGSLSDDAYVYFESGATPGFDPQYDALKLPNTTGLNLSAQAVGTELSISGLPVLGTATVTVPLTVRVPATGNYTLTATQLLNLTGPHPYLRDLQSGALIDLTRQASYSFTLNAANTAQRFELVFSPQQALAAAPAALTQQVALYPSPARTAAYLELPASLSRQATTAQLLDALGRTVLALPLIFPLLVFWLLDALGRTVRTIALPAQSTAHQFNVADLASGVYALRIDTSAGVVVKRLVIE